MDPLNTTIERVYSYLNGLTFSGKIKVLSTFTRLPIAERDGNYIVSGVVQDLKFVEDYVAQHMRWLRMSEIDNIYNFIIEDSFKNK